VSPSTYLLAIPGLLLALSAWIVRWEDLSFFHPGRTADAQRISKHHASFGKMEPYELSPSQRLDHPRYGVVEENATAASENPNTILARPMGGRSALPLTKASLPAASATLTPLGPIPDFVDQPPVAQPVFEPVSSEAGFHITADEVSKLGQRSDRLVFKGSMRMTSPQFHLTGDQLQVRMGKGDAISQADASGHVNVRLLNVEPDKMYRGEAQTASYDPKSGRLVLSGWPKVQGQSREIVGAEEKARIILYPSTGKLATEGRTQTRVAKQLFQMESMDKNAKSKAKKP